MLKVSERDALMRRAGVFAALASAVVGMAVAPAVAQASPAVSTDSARATGPTTAQVTGNADPGGQPTTLHADYALAGEAWCATNGASGAPAETKSQNLGSGNAMVSEIIVTLEALRPSSEYCVELVASNASETAYGGQVRFTTTPSPPLLPLPLLTLPPPAPLVAFAPHIKVEHLRVIGKAVALTVLCQGKSRTDCRVLEQLTVAADLHRRVASKARGSAKNGKSIIVGRRRFAIDGGQTKTLLLSLNSTGRTLLAHSRALRVHLSAMLTNAARLRPLFAAKGIIIFRRSQPKHGR